MRRIIKRIVELWQLYKFLRYVKNQTKDEDIKELTIINGYRAKLENKKPGATGKDGYKVNMLCERCFKDSYVYYDNNNLYLTSRGEIFVEGGLYGFLNEFVTRSKLPVLSVSWIISIIAIIISIVALHHK